MACGTGFCAGKIIASIVAVGLGGYAAYNYTTTGCVLGSCNTGAKVTQTTGNALAVSAESELVTSCTGPKEACTQAELAACESACQTACDTPCDKEATSDAALLEVANTTEAAEQCALGCEGEKVAETSDCSTCAEGGECDGNCGG